MKLIPIIAIICITILEGIALLKGINGTIFSVSCAIIGGLGGYQIKVIRNNIRGGK